MAFQAGFSVERLQRFGAEAVRKERRKQEIGHAVTLACEYLGVSTGEGCYDAALDAQARSHVGFGWRVTAGAFEHVRSVTVRCDQFRQGGRSHFNLWTWTGLLTIPRSASQLKAGRLVSDVRCSVGHSESRSRKRTIPKEASLSSMASNTFFVHI